MTPALETIAIDEPERPRKAARAGIEPPVNGRGWTRCAAMHGSPWG